MMNQDFQLPGCVIFLVDESSAMDVPIQEDLPNLPPGQSPRPRAANVSAAINSWIRRLGADRDPDVTIVGYKTSKEGEAVVGCRLDGAFGDHEFVPVNDLAATPLREEERVQRRPNPAGFGPPVEEPITIPIWYAPEPEGKAPQVAAFEFCAELLDRWEAAQEGSYARPLIVHVFAAGSADGNPHKAISQLLERGGDDAGPLVMNIHLSSAKLVPSTVYPSNRYYLPPGVMKDLYDRSSPLTESQRHTLRLANVPTNPKAAAMLYNAKMPDVAQAFKMIEAEVRAWPQKPVELAPTLPVDDFPPLSGDDLPGDGAETVNDDETATIAVSDRGYSLEKSDSPPVSTTVEDGSDADSLPDNVWSGESFEIVDEAETVPGNPAATLLKEGLVLLLCDRSVADPYSVSDTAAWPKLQERANAILTQAGKAADGRLELAVVTYGVDGAGETDVRATFEGPLVGQSFVKDEALTEGALRVEENWIQVPDGTGGLTSIPQTETIFLEQEPSAPAGTEEALNAAAGLVNQWCSEHPDACLPPVVVHLTRGPGDREAYHQHCQQLTDINTAAGSLVLYHLVVTEQPHRSVSYPADDSQLEWPGLQGLFELSSPLLGREELSVSKPTIVAADARGLVLNAKFDLLWDGIRAALADDSY